MVAVPNNQHAEAACSVRLLDDFQDVLDVLLSLLQVACQHKGHDCGHAVLGHQGLVVQLVEVLPQGYLVATQGNDLVVERFHSFAEGRIVDGQGLRLDDNCLGYRLRAS